jgi:hypothetical protein
MGEFAVNVAVAYQIGAARGDYSIFSAMDIRDRELFAAFGRNINELSCAIARTWTETARPVPLKIDPRWLEAASTNGPQKTLGGWNARILVLHLWPPQVVSGRSVHPYFQGCPHCRALDAQFHRVAGAQLVADKEEAYRYWLRAVARASRLSGPMDRNRLSDSIRGLSR